MISRILYVITDSGVGGTEKVLLNLLRHVDRKRFEPCGVVVLKSRREMAEAWEETGVPVEALGLRRWPTPLLISKLRGIVSKRKPALVHAFLYHSIQVSRIVKFFDSSFALVTSPRVNYRFAPRPAVLFDQFMKRLDDGVVCESEAGRQALITGSGYNPDKTMVAWNSVDGEVYRFDSAARQRVRAELGVGPAELLIGCVGRLHHQKGFDIFLRALQALRSSPVKFKAVIAGSGPEEAALKKKAAEIGVPVQILGERRDVPAFLSALDIFVQSSRYEGLSNALLEALSCGRACAATAVDGTLDFSRDGENLLLVKPDDEVSLAVALGLLLEKPELRKKLEQNATITAQNFSVERMIRGFEQAYVHSLS